MKITCKAWLTPLIFLTTYIFTVTPEQTHTIAHTIWQNECNGSIDGLTTWNEGESCASLGIGHFIWYPAGKRDRYHETFPEFVRFLEQRHIIVPDWLTHKRTCPWTTRKAFYNNMQSSSMQELRSLLMNTINEQGFFIVKRFEEALPLITQHLSHRDAEHVTTVINRLTATPQGLYALIDYLNFKGAGTDPKERYHGKGWGLTHVLLATNEHEPDSLTAFSTAAQKILRQRVHNAPKDRHEERWLPGWLRRIDSYTKI